MLDLLFGPKRSASAGWNGGSGIMSLRRTAAGVAVNEEVALTYPAYWCGCRIIAETESSLPLPTYRRETTDESSGRAGNVSYAGDFYLYDLLKVAPNPAMPSQAMREGRTLDMLNRGNGFAEIEWDSYNPARRTKVVALWPICASRVTPVTRRNRPVDYQAGYRYAVRNDDGTLTMLLPDEMLHVPGVLPEDGVWGKSVVAYHRETIGMGKAIQLHGASYFGSGGQPPAILTGLSLRDPEQRRLFREDWKRIHGSPGNNEIAIIPEGGKYEKLSFSNEDGQYLETAKAHVHEIARIMRLPAYMLEETEGTQSYASVEQRGQDFLMGFLFWLIRWESHINLKCILPKDRATYYCEHNVNGLLRGDFASRMAGYVHAIQNGLMTINEVRRLENLNNIGEAGDVNFIQLNMTTVQRMAEDPPDPKAKPAARDGGSFPSDGEAAHAFTLEMLAKMQERTAAGVLPAPAVPRIGYSVPEAAVRGVLVDAFTRVLTKAAGKYERVAAKVKANPAAWLASFVEEHRVSLAEMLTPSAAILARDGVGPAELLAKLAESAAASLADEPKATAAKVADQIIKEQRP